MLSSLSNCHETPSSRRNFVFIFLLHKGGCFVGRLVNDIFCVPVCVCARVYTTCMYAMHSYFAPFMFAVHLLYLFFFWRRGHVIVGPVISWCAATSIGCALFSLCDVQRQWIATKCHICNPDVNDVIINLLTQSLIVKAKLVIIRRVQLNFSKCTFATL